MKMGMGSGYLCLHFRGYCSIQPQGRDTAKSYPPAKMIFLARLSFLLRLSMGYSVPLLCVVVTNKVLQELISDLHPALAFTETKD